MESREISFVTWPDGKVANESLTVAGERLAREGLIRSWLPADWFGDLNSYSFEGLWRGMQSKGFRSHTITVSEDGTPTLKDQIQ